jgi:hypothetical protein
MPLIHDLMRPPIGWRRCPKCGLPMFLSEMEATEWPCEDVRIFECPDCTYAETVLGEPSEAA